MSTRTRDLKSATKVISSKVSVANSVGGAVPAGMKRWVTFIALDNFTASVARQCKVYLASVSVSNPTRVSCVATANLKWVINLRATAVLRKLAFIHPAGYGPFIVPNVPSDEAPLFTILPGKWLGLYCSGTTANLFIQYFDE